MGGKRILGVGPGAVLNLGYSLLPYLVAIGAWQIVGLFYPQYLFPSLVSVFRRCVEILTTGSMFADVAATALRILAGMVGAFVIGTLLALMMARSSKIDRFFSPLLSLFQGIPALSWVVFAIIWFHGIEPRIFFIMVVTTLPAFAFQILGALKAMPRDLVEMILSFRPTRMQMLRIMIIPAVLPDVITAWKVNLGNASRVVVVAELVGATGGIGYELMQQQQLFDMAGAMAWTFQIVLFVFVMQVMLAGLENILFRYRAVSERSL
jgi:ABC-type nitrate/sulfonate/bicarbonate transport system permease component